MHIYSGDWHTCFDFLGLFAGVGRSSGLSDCVMSAASSSGSVQFPGRAVEVPRSILCTAVAGRPRRGLSFTQIEPRGPPAVESLCPSAMRTSSGGRWVASCLLSSSLILSSRQLT